MDLVYAPPIFFLLVLDLIVYVSRATGLIFLLRALFAKAIFQVLASAIGWS